MAQKKLLFVLKLLLVLPPLVWDKHAVAEDLIFKAEEIDKNWINKLSEDSLNTVLNKIKNKYGELEKMLGKTELLNKDSNEFDHKAFSILASSPALRVFVSSSMAENLLKSYVEEAKACGAILVFNGLPGNSWKKLIKLVIEIVGSGDLNNVAIQIDDEAFKRFNVKSVPTFVLSDEEDWLRENKEMPKYDRVVGNISIERALKLFAKEGDLAIAAKNLLEQGNKNQLNQDN